MEWRGREWSGREWRGGKGRAGQGRVPDCLGGLSRVGISSRSTRPWNGQPPSSVMYLVGCTINALSVETMGVTCRLLKLNLFYLFFSFIYNVCIVERIRLPLRWILRFIK